MSLPAAVQWRTAAPLWGPALQDSTLRRFDQPALLRFASDEFMPEFAGALALDALDPLVARYENRYLEAAGWLTPGEVHPEPPALKLYQPVHGRFYLVAASLVQGVPGLPDMPLAAEAGESVGFVLRRLVPEDPFSAVFREPAYAEYGWEGGEWKPVGTRDLLPAEKRLPLYEQPSAAQRLIRFGLVPAYSRPQYLAARRPEPPPMPDPRAVDFTGRILAAIADLAAVADTAEAIRLSTLLMVDLAGFLEEYVPAAWAQIPFQPQWLHNLGEAWAAHGRILAGDPGAPAYNLRDVVTQADIDGLARWVTALLQAGDARGRRRGVAYRRHRRAGDLFLVRCLYERPQAPPLLSRGSQPFQMAGHYDGEAPVRPKCRPEVGDGYG